MPAYQELQLEAFSKLESEFGAGQSPAQVIPIVPDAPQSLGLCLSSLFYLPKEMTDSLEQNLIEPIRNADPNHYYFQPESLHVTIQNVRTVAMPANFSEATIETARAVFGRVVPKHNVFDLTLKRIFEPPTSLSISALSDEKYGELVKELRAELEKAGIPDNKRYGSGEIVFGNVTFCRFKSAPNGQLKALVKSLKNNQFGKFVVDRVHLVVTDAVCSPKNTTITDTFYFNGAARPGTAK
jgi:2'-5' RNA ligase